MFAVVDQKINPILVWIIYASEDIRVCNSISYPVYHLKSLVSIGCMLDIFLILFTSIFFKKVQDLMALCILLMGLNGKG